jgi:CarD family transcriptional regulator
MTLRIPTSKFGNVRVRKLSDPETIQQAQQVLGQRARAGRGNWPRLAQEYETKINSGDLIAIAEVVRDLHRTVNSEQGYGERQLYEMALDRLSREIAVVQHITEEEAVREIKGLLVARPPLRNKMSASG